MIVGSTFSGVGGLDLGLERAGMRVLWQAESDDWCRRVLRWHWPDADVYDDVRAVSLGSFDEGERRESGSKRAGTQAGRRRKPGGSRSGGIDVLCGGFPCQDLSVAGKRAGLAGERSGLFFEFARIANELRPSWIVVENVVGLLSSANGRDFGIVLSTLAEIGYGLAWRVVDARYFGVPQRRRRVFIIGRFGDDGSAAVRAIGAGGEGDLAAGRCSWQVASPGAFRSPVVSGPLTSRYGKGVNTTMDDGAMVIETGKLGTYGQSVSKPLASLTGGARTTDLESGAYVGGATVRRLTPTECERLMSWPDGWTAVDGDKTPDNRRYAACGNGVVSNVSEWIGRRILAVEGGEYAEAA